MRERGTEERGERGTEEEKRGERERGTEEEERGEIERGTEERERERNGEERDARGKKRLGIAPRAGRTIGPTAGARTQINKTDEAAGTAKRRGATPSLAAGSERDYRRRCLHPPTPTPRPHRSRRALEVGVRGRGR